MESYFHQFRGFLYIDFGSTNRRFSSTFDIYFDSYLARCFLSIFENILLFKIQTTIIKEWFLYHQLTFRQLLLFSSPRENQYEKSQKKYHASSVRYAHHWSYFGPWSNFYNCDAVQANYFVRDIKTVVNYPVYSPGLSRISIYFSWNTW